MKVQDLKCPSCGADDIFERHIAFVNYPVEYVELGSDFDSTEETKSGMGSVDWMSSEIITHNPWVCMNCDYSTNYPEDFAKHAVTKPDDLVLNEGGS